MQSVTLHFEEKYGIVSPNKTRLMTYAGISELYYAVNSMNRETIYEYVNKISKGKDR